MKVATSLTWGLRATRRGAERERRRSRQAEGSRRAHAARDPRAGEEERGARPRGARRKEFSRAASEPLAALHALRVGPKRPPLRAFQSSPLLSARGATLRARRHDIQPSSRTAATRLDQRTILFQSARGVSAAAPAIGRGSPSVAGAIATRSELPPSFPTASRR